MKVTVELPLADFEEFLRWREGKSESDRRYTDLLRRAYKLREKLLDAITFDQNKKNAEIMNFEDLMTAIELAYEI